LQLLFFSLVILLIIFAFHIISLVILPLLLLISAYLEDAKNR